MTTVASIHPGEVLMEEFLEPLQISQNRVAVAIGVPPRRIPVKPRPEDLGGVAGQVHR